VRAFASRFVPSDWALCDGRELLVASNEALFVAIGHSWGGARTKFHLPDLRSATLVGVNVDSSATPKIQLGERRLGLAPDGAGFRPRLHVYYCICVNGLFPNR
jgi:microcystin-dependent protein